jgi:predicted ArsR family transcriptional regulator
MNGPATPHRALAHRSRVRLLDLLRGAPDGLDLAELARRSDLHPNTVRVHLDKLVEAGLVAGEPVRRGGRGRPAIRYRAAPVPDEDGYRLLSAMLASALSPGPDGGPSPAAEAAGRRWGRHLAASRSADPGATSAGPTGPADEVAPSPTREAAAIRELFALLGFAPAPDGERLVLHDCPFRPLARQHPDVVCGLHLGLLRGALDAHGASGDDAWLDPFVTPTRCVAGLTMAGPSGTMPEVHP